MKKIVTTAFFVILCCMTANAQYYLGGGLGIGYSKMQERGADPTAVYQFAPEIGYNINEKMALGLQPTIGYATTSGEGQFTYGANVYGRYYFGEYGCLRFFEELTLGVAHADLDDGYDYGSSYYYGDHPSVMITSLALRPGVSAQLGKKVHLSARMDLLRYSNYHFKYDNYSRISFGLMNADGVAPVEFSLVFDL